jgi:ankyrin repeat protein
VDKRAFIKAVRDWEAATVAASLANEASLARYVDKVGKTPLHHCAEIDPRKFRLQISDSIDTAKALLDAGADVNAIRVIMDDGQKFLASPLWYSVAWGKNLPLARMLLETGAHPDDNAVSSAIWDQDLMMAELLRSHGGNIDHKSNGETPLIRTLKAKRFRLLNWLTENGANINAKDAAGYTALHHAAKGSHTLAQVEELLKHGAKPNLKAKDGTSPVSLAQAAGKSRMVDLLRSASA